MLENNITTISKLYIKYKNNMRKRTQYLEITFPCSLLLCRYCSPFHFNLVRCRTIFIGLHNSKIKKKNYNVKTRNKVKLDVVEDVECFMYLELAVLKKGNLEEDIKHKIKCGWIV